MNEMLFIDKQNSQSGQATVEYILLVAIGVALILGLSKQFIAPFGKWVDNYMGPYLECLIDVGELPAFGNSNDDSKCPTTAFKGEKPGGSGGSQGRGRNNIGGGGSRDSGAGSGQRRQAGRTSSSQDGGGGSGGGSSDGGGSRSGSRSMNIGSRQGADGPGSSGNENQIVEKAPASKFFKSKTSSNSATLASTQKDGSGNVQYVPLGKKEREQLGEKTSNSTIISDGDVSGKKAKKLIVKPTSRKIAEEEPDPPWSFSQYLKYFVIIAIIVALVLFIGGQVASVSKSMEK